MSIGIHEHFVPPLVRFQVWGTPQSLPTQTLTSHRESPMNLPHTSDLGTSYDTWIHHLAAQNLTPFSHHHCATKSHPLFNKWHPVKASILGGIWATSTHQFANTEIIPSRPSVKNGSTKIENPFGTPQVWTLKTNFSSSSCSLAGIARSGHPTLSVYKIYPSLLKVYSMLYGRQYLFTCFHGGHYLTFRQKKKNHHLVTKPQHFCTTSNPASHIADKQVLFWCRRATWKGRGNQWVETGIFVALETWKSLGNRQTIDFPASSQLYLLNKIPHVV